ncbi:MAG TPA: hypothetical protein VFI97_07480 [Arthrobacter sp.]|nr:hypothetical protein [Arthrobacter sp.]
MARRHNNGGAVGWGQRNGLGGGGGNRRNDNSWLPGWAGQIQQHDRNPGGGGGGHHSPHQGGGNQGGHHGGQGAGGGQQGGQTDQQVLQDFLNAQLKAQQDKYNQSAIDDLTNLFDTYGLGSLAPKIAQWIQQGMSQSAILAALRETPEYKQRFPGMDALRKQGYNAISEAQYLQLEDSYHKAMQSAGLPPGFYDNPQDFVKFMSNGVDPAEVAQRAQDAADLANQVDPTQRQLLQSMYGIGTGDLAAYFLDPKRAMPLLQKQVDTLKVASAAKHAGIDTNYNSPDQFQSLVDNGVSAGQAAAGFAQIASEIDPLKNLSQIWGTGGWDLNQEEQATFFGDKNATRKRKRLIDTERAAFSGASGFNPSVSGQGSTAGLF